MTKIIFGAEDVAPCMAFEQVIPLLEEAGAQVLSCLYNSDADTHSTFISLEDEVASADMVILGMSSEGHAVGETWLAEIARSHQVSTCFYADTFGGFRREWFQKTLSLGDVLFVVNEEDRKQASEQFPNLEVFALGNPLWQQFFNRTCTRQEARKFLGVSDEDYVIIVPFGKNLQINEDLLTAVAKKRIGKRVTIVVGIHPGVDENGTHPETMHYRDIATAMSSTILITTKSQASSSVLLDAADLIVESASSIGIEAAHLRIPVINFFSQEALDRLKGATGSEKWPLCETGCAMQVLADSDELRTLIRTHHAIFQELNVLPVARQPWETLRSRQESVFPKQGNSDCVLRKMAEFILELAE